MLLVFTMLLLPFFAPSGRFFPLISGLLVGVLVPFIDATVGSRTDIRFVWYSIRYRNRMIRVSLSYIFRIKVDDRYLFIKSARAPVYLPVGGVYKMTAGAKGLLDSMGVVADDLVPVDAVSRDDLRVRVPGKNLSQFMRWFNRGTSRETDHWREFYQELVESGIVDADVFTWIMHEHIQRRVAGMQFSPHAQAWEIIVADIYELLPSPEQLANLQELRARGHAEIEWLTQEEIRRSGASPGAGQRLQTGAPVSQWVI
ncbi:hypothetical protein V6W11_12485 [Micromonospora profundi]|uniref:SMODS-associated NUDIX domain-containing protein n=1 Tax=Micromonospora profundi TaxID=1420889 RepID=UPI002FF2E56E